MKTHAPRRQETRFLTKSEKLWLRPIQGLGGGASEDGGREAEEGVWKLRKIIVRGFNGVSEARLGAFLGGGLESSNTCSVWSVELLSKQAIVRMQGRAFWRDKRQPTRPAAVVHMK